MRIKQKHLLILIWVFLALVSILRVRLSYALGQYGVETSQNFIEARKTLGGLDAGSYLQGAMALVEGNFNNPKFSYIWGLWPPGMPFLEAILLNIFGWNSSPLILLTSTTLIATNYIFYRIIILQEYSKHKLISLSLIFFLFFSAVTQGWILDQGIMYAEIYQIFFLSIILIKIANKTTIDKKECFVIGLLLFGSALFRATGYTVIQVFAVLALLSLLTFTVLNKVKIQKIKVKIFKMYFLIASIAVSLTTIWILIRNKLFGTNSLKWVTNGENWAWYWYKNSDLESSGWGIVKNIDNWGCYFQPHKCISMSQKLIDNKELQRDTLNFVLHHPLEFLAKRLVDMWQYWKLNGRWLYPDQNKLPASINFTEGAIFLILVFIALLVAMKTIKQPLSFMYISMAVGTTLPLLIFHLESRYFIPIKFLSVIYLILYFHSSESLRTRNIFRFIPFPK